MSGHGQMRAVVVGAGAGGLAAAMTLAAQGAQVTVFEALDAPGGKMGTSWVEGVEFDTGPSLLTMRHVLEDLFGQAGTSLQDELSLVAHGPLFEYRWPDGATLTVHTALEDTITQVRSAFGPQAAQQFQDFMHYSKQIWAAAEPNFIACSAPSFGSMLKLGLTKLGQVAKIDPFRTMAQGIARHTTHPKLKDLFWRYATYNGSDPRRAPATLNCIAWVEMGLGGWGVQGGMAQIPRALETVGRRLGVQYHYGTPVTHIQVLAGQTQGVTLADGQVHPCDLVVVNAEVAHLVDSLLHQTPHQIEPMTPSRSMSGWNGILRLPQGALRLAHTVLFPHHYEDEFAAIFDRAEPPKDPTLYLCDQGLNHHRPGWSSPPRSAVFVMANAPSVAHPDRHLDAHRQLADRVTARLTQEGLMPHEGFVWTRTPSELAATFPGSQGAIYGAASNSQTAAFKRPANRVSSIAGLYLASGSAHPGGGVPLCLLSGMTSAAQALADWG